MPDPLIADVSDTARWMAAIRAVEHQRPERLFDDPLAERLAGDRGRAIAAAAPRFSRRNAWWWITRTTLIDELIRESVAGGCQRVVNLAAGFDTRPYRLELPAITEWIEADLPAIISDKDRLLAGEEPRCRLTRVPINLADPRARQAFFTDTVAGAPATLVITEGLLLYLDNQQVSDLTCDLNDAEIGSWVTDLIAPMIIRRMMRSMPSLENAPMKFLPSDGIAFFERHGWEASDIRPIHKEAARRRRLPLLLRAIAQLPEPNPRKLAHVPWTGVVRFRRKTADSSLER